MPFQPVTHVQLTRMCLVFPGSRLIVSDTPHHKATSADLWQLVTWPGAVS